jgi:hypothetical protein
MDRAFGEVLDPSKLIKPSLAANNMTGLGRSKEHFDYQSEVNCT